MSLYRKYRPQNFANLVGQDHVRMTLVNALKTQNVNHAYLFTGPRGTGKTSTARLLAKAINCENLQDAEPCETCEICLDIAEGKLMDLIEIDAASNRGIDEIRDLREKIQFSPTRARSKVYIIDEVHMLTKEAFNALLKTLEEPPAHVYFILATTEVHKIPETILSRCQRFDFKRIEDRVLQDRLAFIAKEEAIETEMDGLKAIVHSAQGGLRDAIGLLEQLSVNGVLSFAHVQEILGISGKVSIEKLYQWIEQTQIQQALEEISALYTEGYDLVQFNKDFLEFLRQKLLEAVYTERRNDVSRLLTWIQYFQESYESLKYATIAQLPLEVAIIQACGILKARENSSEIPVQITPLETSAEKKSLEFVERTHQSLHTTKLPEPSLKIPEAAPSLPPNSGSSDFTLEALQKQWSRVLEHIKTPTARRLMSSFSLKKIENQTLFLQFQTQFHLGKMMEITNRTDFEEAIFQASGINFKIVGEVGKIELAGENAGQSFTNSNEATNKLLEVFGGEMVFEDEKRSAFR